jgi:transmembrane sensor
MPDSTDWQLIDRYIAGEASPDEIAVLQARAKSDPAWAQAVDLLRANFTSTRTTPRDTDLAWSRLQSRLAADSRNATPQLSGTQSRNTPLHTRPWLRIAAIVLVFVGAFAVWRSGAIAPTTRRTTAEMLEATTPNGSRRTITLTDGSQVTLNAGSTLRWPHTYGTGARDVYLEGEAFFSVTHDSTAPFRVHARGTVAHDLGTRFTVSAYPELTSVEVAVTDGAVSLRHDRASSDSAILRAGQLGRLGASGAPTVESNIPLDRWTAWTSGSLVLDGLTLADAIPQLERWYDITVTVPDSALAQRRITARFRDETLPQMLDALTLALGARSQQSGRAVTLLPGSR